MRISYRVCDRTLYQCREGGWIPQKRALELLCAKNREAVMLAEDFKALNDSRKEMTEKVEMRQSDKIESTSQEDPVLSFICRIVMKVLQASLQERLRAVLPPGICADARGRRSERLRAIN